ncbi:MAG: NRDE family protein [Betaproteobacteria bacterium]|nr:MAG: NRDE family protein [Betaproteobacteria bacterium]
MCLILFSLGHHPGFPLVVAANRDESYGRPAAPVCFWPDAPYIAGGRDLRAGGTWLGITRHGRWGALTNYRRGGSYRENAPSRGQLVSDYLESDISPEAYLRKLEPIAAQFNGFNLLVGDASGLHYLSNRDAGPRQVEPGIHGLSNHLLDTPWPKVEMGKQALHALGERPRDSIIDYLLDALSRRSVPAESELPDTGVGQAQERVLSPPFIAGESYGTRASTVILVDEDGQVSIEERAFGPFGALQGSTSLRFSLDADTQAAPIRAPATTQCG